MTPGSLNPDDWVNPTPPDDVDAIYFVAAALSLPVELVSMDMVWRFRWGMTQIKGNITGYDQDRINEYYRLRDFDYYDDDAPF